KVGNGLRLGARCGPVCHDIRGGQHLREGAQQSEAAMSAVQPARPFSEPSPLVRWLAGAVVVFYAIVTILPLIWIGATAFKSQEDAIAYPPKVLFKPTLEGFVGLFTGQTHQSHDFIAKLPSPKTWYEKIARDRDMVIAGPSRFVERFLNSLIIGFGSTIL